MVVYHSSQTIHIERVDQLAYGGQTLHTGIGVLKGWPGWKNYGYCLLDTYVPYVLAGYVDMSTMRKKKKGVQSFNRLLLTVLLKALGTDMGVPAVSRPAAEGVSHIDDVNVLLIKSAPLSLSNTKIPSIIVIKFATLIQIIVLMYRPWHKFKHKN